MTNGGVYQVLNTTNGRAYIGSTTCFRSRWKVHRRDLRANKHANRALQNAWNKYGEDAFEFSVFKNVDDFGDLVGAEDAAMQHARSLGVRLYNIRLAATNNLGLKLGPRPKSVRDKISKSRLGTPAYNRGLSWNEEGRVLSADSRKRMGARRAALTQCPHGHEYDVRNTYIAKNGQRQCRACSAARTKRTRDRVARGVEGTNQK